MNTRALATAFLLLAPPASAQIAAERRTISVSGSADVRVQPDHVVLELGVEVKDPDLLVATKDADARLERVVSYLRAKLGAANVRTDFVSIVPSYQWETGHRTYFTVQRSLLATVRDVAQFDTVLQGSISRGVTMVRGVQFRTSELKKHRESARSLAVKAAREKAQLLAADAGVRVGKVMSINESSWGGWSSWYPGYWGNSNVYGSSQVAVSAPSTTDDSGPHLALGEITVSAAIQTTFEID